MSQRKLPGRGPGRGMGDRKSSFARSFFTDSDGSGEEALLDEGVPVPRSRPMGRMASRRNLTIKRPSMIGAASQRGISSTYSGESLGSAAASLAGLSIPSTTGGQSGRGSLTSPMVASAPPRNAEENWLRQSMLRQSGKGGVGFDMNAIHAALKEDDALEAGFDDEEVLEQYKIMAQHEAALRVKANTGFDIDDYEKRRKAMGNDSKDKKELYGGGKKPKLGLPPPQHVLSNADIKNGNGSALTSPPFNLFVDRLNGGIMSENCLAFLQLEQEKAEAQAELSLGDVGRSSQIAQTEGEVNVRCWGCKVNLKVNYMATLVQCPDCNTVSQTRRKN